MPQVRCPICRQQFDPAATPTTPFCSPRCRQVDLGRWLGEKYSVPSERSEDDLGEERDAKNGE